MHTRTITKSWYYGWFTILSYIPKTYQRFPNTIPLIFEKIDVDFWNNWGFGTQNHQKCSENWSNRCVWVRKDGERVRLSGVDSWIVPGGLNRENLPKHIFLIHFELFSRRKSRCFTEFRWKIAQKLIQSLHMPKLWTVTAQVVRSWLMDGSRGFG